MQKTLINTTLDQFPLHSLEHAFAHHYLKTIPERVLKNFESTALTQFIHDRFLFFKTAVSKSISFRVQPVPNSDRHYLEFVSYDASYLIVTVEALLKEYGFKVIRTLHPILNVEVDAQNALKQILSELDNGQLFSVTYIEFEGALDKALLKKLEKSIQNHLEAILLVQKDHRAIGAVIEEVKEKMIFPAGNVVEPIEEWQNLVDWLRNLNFTFLGFGIFHYSKKGVDWDAKSGLGLLNESSVKTDFFNLFSVLKAHTLKRKDSPNVFKLDTIKVNSPIQRFEPLMHLSLKVQEGPGKVKEYVFLGLLKRSSLQSKNYETPIIRRKMQSIFESKHMLPGSYNYNEVTRIFTATPKYELFRTPVSGLMAMAEQLLSIVDHDQIYCFQIPHPDPTISSLYLVIPIDLATPENMDCVTEFLKNFIAHKDMECYEARREEYVRLHVYYEGATTQITQSDIDQIESQITKMIQHWQDGVKETLLKEFPDGAGLALHQKFTDLFPKHYQVRRTPDQAVRDIVQLNRLSQTNSVQFSLFPFYFSQSQLSGKATLLTIYNAEKIDLIQVMPILQNLGVHVFDELTSRIGTPQKLLGYIHFFRIADKKLQKLDEDSIRENLVELLDKIFKGQTANDPLNALTINAGLNWRSINLLQLFRNYYLQLGPAFTSEHITRVLVENASITQLIVSYFETKFKPGSSFGSVKERLSKHLPKIEAAFQDALAEVSDVSDDIILRQMLNLVQSSVRTNFYKPIDADNTTISVKFDCHKVHQMPAPIPFREIYVHDVGVEGCHIRFGKVARGGLRWSDRPNDFRKEVLGLVKTQQTKNVVIVPVGSKGGFILKRTGLSREEQLKEAELQYQKFISGLLDLTDNYTPNGQIVTPKYTVAYEEKDPYLVVAADKGTANFSDLANGVSERYEFWLGDAFASGGSVGYNHKVVGITARGGWECVKLHFSEMGKDIQKEEFTVAGIGDMSGDVFGNGMLLSPCIQLQAAFNHIHIFIDPNPNAKTSWKERKRLFDLPRSTWKDYNPSLISPGGGVFDRKAKSITLTPEMKVLFGTKAAVMTGEEMIKAILKMKVDLLWFGGIGTYIKSADETHLEVGDPANDPVRINHDQCQATVIGEGANLGITSRARILLDRDGHRLNADAIDNSAGVNMSDYEVNIKILLKQLLATNKIPSMAKRNQILEIATEEVAGLCLANNRGQHRLLSLDVKRSKENFHLFSKLLNAYVTTGFLDAKSERIPDFSELEELEGLNLPFPRPVLAILQAYVKMDIFDRLIDSNCTESPLLAQWYEGYFPQTIRDAFESELEAHPLKPEIIATRITNYVVNHAGTTFHYHVGQITGKSTPKIVEAYLFFDTLLGCAALRKRLFAEAISEIDRYKALSRIEEVLESLVIDYLQLPNLTLDPSNLGDIQSLVDLFKKHVLKEKSVQTKIKRWQNAGTSAAVATEMTIIEHSSMLLDIILLHQQHQAPILDAIQLSLGLNEGFEFGWVLNKLDGLDLTSAWDWEHKQILVQGIRFHKIHLLATLSDGLKTKKLLGTDSKSIIHYCEDRFGSAIRLYFQSVKQLKTGAVDSLTPFSVAISRLNFLSIS